MSSTTEVPAWVPEAQVELANTDSGLSSDKYGLPADASAGGMVASQLECDYDKNPTVLYQALEARQWDYAAGLFKGSDISKEVATWVVRKETTGKLRWRLLPLHAAIIFGGPLRLIELLLSEYTIAAQCKDDQGMLPLHLAFRHETTWDIVEELLTAFPQAVAVKDRKGRIPLLSAIKAPVASSATSINSSMSHMPSEHSKAFKSAVSVLEIYTQVAVSQERQRAILESRSVLEQRVGQLQDSHLQTLTLLKKEWQTQQEESKQKINKLADEKREG
jgi:hypothetical protein